MGDAMLIPYDVLPSSKSGWEDGLHWLEEVEAWSTRYEEENMVYADTNSQLANAHLEVIFLSLPPRLMYVGRRVISVILGERLRRAMG